MVYDNSVSFEVRNEREIIQRGTFAKTLTCVQLPNPLSMRKFREFILYFFIGDVFLVLSFLGNTRARQTYLDIYIRNNYCVSLNLSS